MEKLKRSATPSCFDCGCNLCLEEKIQIRLYFDPTNILNQKCELIARCWHKINLDCFQKQVNKQKMNNYDLLNS